MATTPSDVDIADEHLAEVIAGRGQSDHAAASARAAFDQIYRRHARPLLAFLSSRVSRADLDDLHQDVWQRVWHHLPDGFRGGRFRAWLYQIARNALIDQSRKRRPEPLGEEPLPDRCQVLPDHRLIEHERMAALKRCLERLGEEAAVLVRARLGGEDYPEVCRKLGMKPERAHKLFHTAKIQLQACVERALA